MAMAMLRRNGNSGDPLYSSAARAASTAAASSYTDGEEESLVILEEDEDDHDEDDDKVYASKQQLDGATTLPLLRVSSPPNESLSETFRRNNSTMHKSDGSNDGHKQQSVLRLWLTLRWSLCSKSSQCHRFFCRNGGSIKRPSLCCCLVYGCIALALCLAVAIPIALHVIEERFPNIPLQLRVDIYPPNVRGESSESLPLGKSCRYAGHRRRWVCQSCRLLEDSAQPTKSPLQTRCHVLRPKGRCPSFPRRNWEDATHSTSHYDPNNAAELDYRTIRHASGRFIYHSQPQCSGSLTFSSACFNLEQCRAVAAPLPFDRRSTTTISTNASQRQDLDNHPHTYPPLPVYVNVTNAHGNSMATSLMELALQQSIIRLVSDHRQACLILVFADTYETVSDMHAAEHWKSMGRRTVSTAVVQNASSASLVSPNTLLDIEIYGGGRNHLIYNMSRFRFKNTKRLSSDAPITLYHVGLAAVASDAWISSIFRPGFDQALPLPRHWIRKSTMAKTASTSTIAASDPSKPRPHVDIHRPRKWLLTFRGGIKDGPQPYYQHRWLAAEYWTDDDVLVDVRCIHTSMFGAISKTIKDYDHPAAIYDELMWESTFGFAPGGSGVGSYRFGEILSTGGIPVVTHDLVLPLAPEVDWSGCVVRVSEARIIDVPHLLRNMSATEVVQRQERCWHLLQTVLGDRVLDHGNAAATGVQVGWTSDERVTFAKSMEIWSVRIAHTLALQDQLQDIDRFRHDP